MKKRSFILFCVLMSSAAFNIAEAQNKDAFNIFAERVAKVNAKYKAQQAGAAAPATGNASSGVLGGFFGGGGSKTPAGTALDKLPPNAGMDGYKPDDWEKTGEWALEVASDMATAATFGGVSPGLMQAGGLAVSVYPHPLVLNNYACLLRDQFPNDALFFYFGALEFEPENPLILCNIGFTCLDMGDYATAKEYATLALRSNPECGPAYQILTLCHLKDKNSVLAAETLFKSTLDCIDDMTVMLFDSYFEAIEKLEPMEDEFPLNDVVLELMYENARKYVDTAQINESVDTPTAQLTVKPYPNFGDGERTMLSYDDYWSN